MFSLLAQNWRHFSGSFIEQHFDVVSRGLRIYAHTGTEFLNISTFIAMSVNIHDNEKLEKRRMNAKYK